MRQHRAYSILHIKQVDDDQRLIEGMATSPEPDRMGDVVEPTGVKFRNPLPLLWQHNSDEPIGTARFDKPTEDGVMFRARIPKLDEPGTLKDRLDEAWQSVKLGLVRGVSIGFRPLEWNFMEEGGRHFIETEVLELSLVTIPANEQATITNIKAIDAIVRRNDELLEMVKPASDMAAKAEEAKPKTNGAASGHSEKPASVMAVKATSVVKGRQQMKLTNAEKIAAFEATRAAKAARMVELMDKTGEEGVTLDKEQQDEYDGLRIDVKGIDEHLVRLRELDVLLKTNAKPVEPAAGTDPVVASETRAGTHYPVIQIKQNVAPGIKMARYVIALAQARGNLMQAHAIAQNRKEWHNTPEVEQVLKAAVAAGTTTDPAWAGYLVPYQNLQDEFIELLQPLTIIGRIPGIRRVPFKVKIPRMTTGATVNWVGETRIKPLSALAFDQVTLEFYKIAGIVPLSEELVRFSSPSAEALVRDNLIDEIVKFMDREFIDPTKAAASGVSPASVTNGVTPVTATGTTAAALRADIKTLLGSFLDSNLSPTGGVWIMTSVQALAISMMQTSLGTPEFPGISMNGGTFLGMPVIVSENLPATGGSPTDGYPIIFLKGSEILLADDGQVTIDASREASLQMDSAPDSPPTASTIMVSLWQNNMIAIKAERFVAWEKRRSEAVAFIQNAKYAE